MKNCLILGCGRSGTSLLTGMLGNCGYFVGENSYPANEDNPKGYFEDEQINWINEELITQFVARRKNGLLGKYLFPSSMPYGMRWLARMPLDVSLVCSPAVANGIEKFCSKSPFCYKDPRFSYTLPIWRPYLRNIVYICVFRHPAATVQSILNHCSKGEYSRSLLMDTAKAFEVWQCIYSHILYKHYQQGGEWLFVHYQQLLDGSALARLSNTLDAKPDARFVDKNLNRSLGHAPMPPEAAALYEILCRLASFGQSALGGEIPYLQAR